MKRITSLWKDKKAKSALVLVEDDQKPKQLEKEAKAVEKEAKAETKVKDAKVLRPGTCTRCRKNYRICTCSHCHICGTFVLCLKGMRHCQRCWFSMCDVCVSFVKGDAFLTSPESELEKLQVCENCAKPSALMELARVHKCGAEMSCCSVAPYRFSWGLYVFLRAASVPSLCLNPVCHRPSTFRDECKDCSLPTIPSYLFSDVKQGRPHRLLETSSLKALRKKYELSQERKRMSTLDGLQYLRAVLPGLSGPDPFHVPEHDGTRRHGIANGNQRGERSIALLALICSTAAFIADSPQTFGCGVTEILDHPITRLFYFKSAGSAYWRFGCCGDTAELVVFSKKSFTHLESRAFSGMAGREVWTRHGADGGEEVFLSHSESKARDQGGKRFVCRLYANQSILLEVENESPFQELRREIASLRESGKDVVLCGHGMGGAVATVFASLLLLEEAAVDVRHGERGSLRCITFGAPPAVGGDSLIRFMQEKSLNACFHHFVYRGDLVPRIYFLNTFLNEGSLREGFQSEHCQQIQEFRSVAWRWLENQKILDDGDMSETIRIAQTNISKADGKLVKESRSETLGSIFFPFPQQQQWWCTGDVFATHRQPFDDTREEFQNTFCLASEGKPAPPPLFSPSGPHFIGYYHCFFLDPTVPYQCVESSTQDVRALLTRRDHLRILFGDHMLHCYSRVIIEYVHSANRPT